jgi:hypothetical protein
MSLICLTAEKKVGTKCKPHTRVDLAHAAIRILLSSVCGLHKGLESIWKRRNQDVVAISRCLAIQVFCQLPKRPACRQTGKAHTL